jgi:hypothetical protein
VCDAGGEAPHACFNEALDSLGDAGQRLEVLVDTLLATVKQELEEIQTKLQHEVLEQYNECKRLEKALCLSIQAYAKLQQKKDTEKARFDVGVAAFAARKEHHHLLLSFATAANATLIRLPTLFHRPMAQLLQLLHQHLSAAVGGALHVPAPASTDAGCGSGSGSGSGSSGGSAEPQQALRQLLHRLSEHGLDAALAAERHRIKLHAVAETIKQHTDHQYYLAVDEHDPFVDTSAVPVRLKQGGPAGPAACGRVGRRDHPLAMGGSRSRSVGRSKACKATSTGGSPDEG